MSDPRGSNFKGKAIIAALRRLRCVEHRKSTSGIFYRTPRGKQLPPILPDREVHLNELARIKRALDSEHLDLMAALEGAIKDDRRILSNCPHRDRAIGGTRWVCVACGDDLGAAPEKLTSKAPLAVSIGDRIKAQPAIHVPAALPQTRQPLRSVLAPAPATGQASKALELKPTKHGVLEDDGLPPVPSTQTPSIKVLHPAFAQRPEEPPKMPRPMWTKHSPEFKLNFVRRCVVAIREAGVDRKGAAIATVAASVGLSFSEYYDWRKKLQNAGYDDLDNLPDEAAKVFDTRADTEAHRRGTSRGQRDRLKRMVKAGFSTIEGAARACGISKTALRQRYVTTGICPRVDSPFGLVLRLSDVAKAKVLEEERRMMKKTDNGAGTVVELTPAAILVEIETLMKTGDVEALAELLESRGLKMSDVKRLKREAAEAAKPKPRDNSVEARMARLEEMMTKLVKGLGD